MKRLHEISRLPREQEDVFRLYGYDDLSDRLDLLALLYRDNGDLDKALSTLEESKQFCATHGIEFDGADILLECSEEKGYSQESKNV